MNSLRIGISSNSLFPVCRNFVSSRCQRPLSVTRLCRRTSLLLETRRPIRQREQVAHIGRLFSNFEMIEIPLRNCKGEIICYALIDDRFSRLAHDRWCRHGKGYVVRRLAKGKNIFLHHAVLGWNLDSDLEVDHINGNRLDCRVENLRIVTRAQNAQNKGKIQGTTSRFRGVWWDKSRQKWTAEVKLDRKKVYLGRFDDEEEAAKVASAYRFAMMPFTNEDRRELTV